jgi:hypothetical protein
MIWVVRDTVYQGNRCEDVWRHFTVTGDTPAEAIFALQPLAHGDLSVVGRIDAFGRTHYFPANA